MSNGPLQSLVNGQRAQHISIRDRGFQYGDGCFETVRIIANKPILYPAHLQRLRRGCSLLNLLVDFDALEAEVASLLQQLRLPDAVLKIIVTRGEGGRGYAPPDRQTGSRILQVFDYAGPDIHSPARVFLCQHRLSTNAQLAGIKHLNRLDQVLASAQIPQGFDEGLCLDQDGYLVEGCRSNLLLAKEGALFTPELGGCGVEGVMLNYLIEELARQGTAVARRRVSLAELQLADELLLCNSVFGVWPVTELVCGDEETTLSAQGTAQGRAAKDLANELTDYAE